MSVVKAKIQTVEDMYRLIWTAIANKKPIRAIYKDRPRLFCPHRMGRNSLGQQRVLCYQYGGESESGLAPIGSADNWRCIVFQKLREVETAGWLLEDRTESFASRHLRNRGGYRCRRSTGAGHAEGTLSNRTIGWRLSKERSQCLESYAPDERGRSLERAAFSGPCSVSDKTEHR